MRKQNESTEQTEITEQTENHEAFRQFCYFRSFRILVIVCLIFVLCSELRAQTPKTSVSEDATRLLTGRRVLLDAERDGFMSVKLVKPAPGGKRFAVIACGFECTDNVGFIFNADGTGKRKFTTRWDWILQDKLEWSADGGRLYYFRINSTGAEAPAKAPAEGWVEMDAATRRKVMAVAATPGRRLKTEASYATFHASSEDSVLNLREAPGTDAKIIRKIEGNVSGISFTGQSQKVGRGVWVKIKYEDAVGWVNQNYLYEETPPSQKTKE